MANPLTPQILFTKDFRREREMNLKTKRILSVLSILILFTLSFLSLNHIFAKQWDNTEAIRERMEQFKNLPEDSVDVLFLGSSGLYAGVSPARIFQTNGITSYNLSKSNHTFYTRYYKLLEILEFQQPKLIVMDLSYISSPGVSPSNKNTEIEFRSGYHALTTQSLKEQYLKNLHKDFPEIDPWSYRFPFIKHHNNWDQLTEKGFNVTDLNLQHMGGLLRPKITKVSSKINNAPRTINEYQDLYLKKIIDLLDDKSIDALFVITPRVGLPDQRHTLYQDYATENNIDYVNNATLDFMEEIGLDYAKDFYNEGHLNLWGNRKYSDYLSNYILTNYPNLKKWQLDDNGFNEIENIWGQAVARYEDFYEKETTNLNDNNE